MHSSRIYGTGNKTQMSNTNTMCWTHDNIYNTLIYEWYMICLGSNISLNLRCLTSSFVPWALGPLVLWKSDEKQFDKNMQDCVGQWQQRPGRGRANVKQIQKKCWTMTSTGRRVQLSPPLCRAAPRKPGWNPFQKYDYNWSPRSLGWSIYELNLPLKSVEKSQAVAPVLNPVITQVRLLINIFNQQNIGMKRGKGEYSLPHPTALPPTVRATGKARQAALPEPPGPPAGSRTGDPSLSSAHRRCCLAPALQGALGKVAAGPLRAWVIAAGSSRDLRNLTQGPLGDVR